MPEAEKLELHNLIVAITEISVKIDTLKLERDTLLEKFKLMQLSDDKKGAVVKSLLFK